MTDLHQQRYGSPHAGALLGNYRILEPLNRAGAGSVYRAEHAVLGRPAAVKILRPEQTTNPELVHRFLVEARAATLIRHPGIVEVYDCATTPEGVSYIAMELLEGGSLAQRLGERGRLPEREAVFIARGIASALKAAHREGIIHRDLKPDSIFLVPDPDGPMGERVKVLDFGIAKLMDPRSAFHTQAGALLGSPIYMPPEQARSSSAIDHRADLYSLGCMLYQMLAGRPPFVGSGPAELISMHLSVRPQPPSSLVPVSPALDRIVLRLLEKDPAARFRDAGELVESLDALTGMQPAAAAPAAAPAVDSRPFAGPGLTGPGLAGAMPLSIADERRPDRREPKSAMGLVAGIITVAIVAAVALFVATRGGDEESKPAATGGSGGSAGSAAATEPTPAPGPPKEASPPPPAPTPSPAPKEASPPAPVPTPAPADRQTQAPRETRPKTTTGGTTGGGTRTKRTDPKAGGGSGPVTHPDGPVTKPDSGPVTSPSGALKSPGGSPINPGASLSEDKKPPPPPKPVEQPPAAPPDKLPDKPSAPLEGTP